MKSGHNYHGRTVFTINSFNRHQVLYLLSTRFLFAFTLPLSICAHLNGPAIS